MNPNLHRVIGIDLGTTYSAVASHDPQLDQTVIIRNHETGEQTTPSVISLNPAARKVIVGRAAKQNLPADPLNTVLEIKREMGGTFTEDLLAKYGWKGDPNNRYTVGDPVRVRFAGGTFLPQEISAFTLMKMKEVAEKEIGQEIRDAVVTVPAYFMECHRAATEEAALLAGLYPRQLLPEPTAAAICYGVDRAEATRKTYLIYDLGGGTFDVSIITVDGQHIEVIATHGDRRLGGGDFDDAITAWAVEELRTKHGLGNAVADPRVLALIKLRAEETKIALSTNLEAPLRLTELRPQNPPIVILKRDCFESLIEVYLKKSLTCVEGALQYSEEKGVPSDQIDAVLLVGGSSRIPRVKAELLEYFRKEESFLRMDADPDAVVARGAAMMARRFEPSPAPFDITRHKRENRMISAEGQEFKVWMITEHSLGVGVQNNLFSKILDRGTAIPVTKRAHNYINPDMAPAIVVPVYQGEGRYTPENTLIGTLEITGLEPRPEGFHRFDVTFKVDENGLVSMTVHHLNTGKEWPLQLKHQGTVGGIEGLRTRRQMLLQMYNSSPHIAPGEVVTVSAGGPTGQAAIPAPPPPVGAGAHIAAGVGSVPDFPGVPATAPGAPVDLVAPTREVPDQFKSIIRRAQKQLLRGPNPELARAFNAFVSALNGDATMDSLIELGDDLEDAYIDARG